jgi:signal transduction histidine kinase
MAQKPTYAELKTRAEALEKEVDRLKNVDTELTRYRFLINSAQDAIFLKDLESRYLMANNKTIEAFGLPETEVIGKNDYEIMPDKNEAEKVAIFSRNITERAKLEQMFQQSQKFEAIGTLAGGIAHDFNNLMMSIQGRASLISDDLGPSHPHMEHIDAIKESVRSAAHLAKQLLGFARRGKYEVHPMDINELLLESSAMFGRTKKEIHIHTKLQAPPPVVEADRRQIEQVLLNMYINAWQAMPDGGDLYLQTGAVTFDDATGKLFQVKSGRYVKISITDTGIGMDKSTCQQSFDPFYTTREMNRGTGLGLASAYGIIKNHAGTITVNSEPGKGAEFNVYLPISKKRCTVSGRRMQEAVLPKDRKPSCWWMTKREFSRWSSWNWKNWATG